MTLEELKRLAATAQERVDSALDPSTRWQYMKLAFAYSRMAERAERDAPIAAQSLAQSQ